jgi:hypothetical protein
MNFLLSWLFNDAVSVKNIVSDERIINELGAVGGMRIDRGN